VHFVEVVTTLVSFPFSMFDVVEQRAFATEAAATLAVSPDMIAVTEAYPGSKRAGSIIVKGKVRAENGEESIRMFKTLFNPRLHLIQDARRLGLCIVNDMHLGRPNPPPADVAAEAETSAETRTTKPEVPARAEGTAGTMEDLASKAPVARPGETAETIQELAAKASNQKEEVAIAQGDRVQVTEDVDQIDVATSTIEVKTVGAFGRVTDVDADVGAEITWESGDTGFVDREDLKKLKLVEKATIKADEDTSLPEPKEKADQEAAEEEEATALVEMETRELAEREAALKAKAIAEQEAQAKATEEVLLCNRAIAEKEEKEQAEREAASKAENARLEAAEEAEAKALLEKEARQKAEEEAKAAAEREAKEQTETEVALKAETARLEEATVDGEAKAKAREEARAEYDERASAAEKPKAVAENEAQHLGDKETEEETKATATAGKAEHDEKAIAEQDAQAEEAKAKVESDVQKQVENEAISKAAEEAKASADFDERARAEEQARVVAEKEAKHLADREADLNAEEQAKAIVEKDAQAKTGQEDKSKLAAEAQCAFERQTIEPIPKTQEQGCLTWEVELVKREEMGRYGFSHVNGREKFQRERQRTRDHTENPESALVEGPEALVVKRISPDGLLAEWNQNHPDAQVHPNDRITQVNGCGVISEMSGQLRSDVVILKVVRYPRFFNITLSRREGFRKLGFKFAQPRSNSNVLKITEVSQHESAGLLEELNQSNLRAGMPHLVVTSGMLIEAVNDVSGDAENLAEALRQSEVISMRIRRSEVAEKTKNMRLKIKAARAFESSVMSQAAQAFGRKEGAASSSSLNRADGASNSTLNQGVLNGIATPLSDPSSLMEPLSPDSTAFAQC
jgi:hypothetical protein